MLVMARTRERGMTIVEVVVAATILTIVLAAVVTTVIGAGHAQQRAKLRQQMAASASHTLESLHEDKAWISSLDAATCGTAGCPITLDTATLERITKDSDGREFEITAIGWPVDSDGDGIGAADTDRITPDYVRVSIRVTMSNAQQLLFGTQKPFTIISTIDLNYGIGATGTLLIQTCEVPNQVDERARIDNCNEPRSQLLTQQPSPCRQDAPAVTLPQLLADLRPLALGCNAALDTSADTGAATMLVRPTSTLGFRLSMTTPNGTRLTRVDRDGQHDAARGTYTFTDLPAGTWSIQDLAPGPGYEIWASKAVPSSASVTVPSGQKANALLVQRLQQGRGTYTTSFSRTVQQYTTRRPTATETSLDVGVEGGQIGGTATFYYELVEHTGSPRWAGPAWNGSLGFEAKPAGRYVDDTGKPAQRHLPVRWQPRNGGGEYRFDALSTGLHGAAEFRSCTRRWDADHCGQDTTSTSKCQIEQPTMSLPPSPTQAPTQAPMKGKPNGSDGVPTEPLPCNDEAVWIEPDGGANVETQFYSGGGECYLDGDLVEDGVPRYRSMCDEIVREGVWRLQRVEMLTHCAELLVPWACMGTFRSPGDDWIRTSHHPQQGTPTKEPCYGFPSMFLSRTVWDENGNPETKVSTGRPHCVKDPHYRHPIFSP